MILWGVAYRRLGPMAGELFPVSGAGLRAVVLYLSGDYAGAARLYLRTGGRTTSEYSSDTSGALALADGDLALAERRARTTLALVPGAAEPMLTLAEIALVRGRPDEAERHADAARARHPDHVDALYLAAVAHAYRGDDGVAIDALNRALRQGRSSRDSVFFHVMEVTGHLTRRPPAQQPASLLAHLYRYLRIYDPVNGTRAIAHARRAIAAGDHPADAYLTLGVVYDKIGEHAQSLHAVEQAVAADPRHAEAYRWIAVEAWRRADPLLRYRMARAAFESAPTDPFYLHTLDETVLRALGDPHTMTVLLRRAVELDPRNAEAHERLAAVARLQGDAATAATHAHAARSLWHTFLSESAEPSP
jgi:tetratricopeptide (TPR) repeat protein